MSHSNGVSEAELNSNAITDNPIPHTTSLASTLTGLPLPSNTDTSNWAGGAQSAILHQQQASMGIDWAHIRAECDRRVHERLDIAMQAERVQARAYMQSLLSQLQKTQSQLQAAHSQIEAAQSQLLKPQSIQGTIAQTLATLGKQMDDYHLANMNALSDLRNRSHSSRKKEIWDIQATMNTNIGAVRLQVRNTQQTLNALLVSPGLQPHEYAELNRSIMNSNPAVQQNPPSHPGANMNATDSQSNVIDLTGRNMVNLPAIRPNSEHHTTASIATRVTSMPQPQQNIPEIRQVPNHLETVSTTTRVRSTPTPPQPQTVPEFRPDPFRHAFNRPIQNQRQGPATSTQAAKQPSSSGLVQNAISGPASARRPDNKFFKDIHFFEVDRKALIPWGLIPDSVQHAVRLHLDAFPGWHDTLANLPNDRCLGGAEPMVLHSTEGNDVACRECAFKHRFCIKKWESGEIVVVPLCTLDRPEENSSFNQVEYYRLPVSTTNPKSKEAGVYTEK